MNRLVCILVLGLCAGCGGSQTAPTTPAVPSCQANNTASVSFANNFTATTLDVSWDGFIVTTLSPNQRSASMVVSAGVAHRLDFRVTNTTRLACQTSSPIPIQCATPIYGSCA